MADAISGQRSISGFVNIPDSNNRLFTTVNHPRAFDSEVKVLEHIGSKINPNAKGTIDLFS
jgi:transcriptional accessory protein Tex/SPT6